MPPRNTRTFLRQNKMAIWLIGIAVMSLSLSDRAAERPNAPSEVVAAGPQGMTLMAFKSSGTTDGSAAAAVYETIKGDVAN